MATTKSIACRVGWHRWEAAETEQGWVRRCTSCGRQGRKPGTGVGEDRHSFLKGGWGHSGGTGGMGGSV